MQTQITVQDGKILVSGPYSETNNARYRAHGGKFAGGNWVLPDNDATRATIAELFGTKSEEVEVLISASALSDGQIVQIGGYVLAQRRGRDYRVQMPDGVALDAGNFRESGGSVKNPRVGIDDDMVFRLRCRKSFAEAHGLTIAPTAADSPPSIEI